MATFTPQYQWGFADLEQYLEQLAGESCGAIYRYRLGRLRRGMRIRVQGTDAVMDGIRTVLEAAALRGESVTYTDHRAQTWLAEWPDTTTITHDGDNRASVELVLWEQLED